MPVTGINLTTGLGTGIDVSTTVDALIQAESGPLLQLQSQQQNLQAERATISNFAGLLSNLKTSVDHLRDVGGAFDGLSSSSSNSSIVTVSADQSAQPGRHTAIVNSLATGSSYYSAKQASPTATLNQGSFQLQIGSGTAQTVTVDSSNNSLSGIAATINGLGLNVQATVLQDANGSRLSIASLSTGAASDITISSDTVGLGFIKSSTGADASFSIDDVPLASASNTVTGVLQGLTFNLLSSAPGQQVVLSTAADTQAAQTGVQNFVSAYNSLTQSINAQFAVDPASGKAGVLSGDISLRQLQQELLSDVSLVGGGSAYTTLRSLGVELQNDGTLQVNQSTLTSALTGNFAAVKSAFQTSGGYGQLLGADLIQANDSVTGALATDGAGVDSQLKNVSDQEQSFNDYLTQRRTALTAEYTKISVLLQQEPSQLAQIQAELGFKNSQ